MQHFKKAHRNMVFGQFLPNKLTDPRVLHGFEEVWREGFIPESQRALSYGDQSVTLTPGRKAMSPLSFMRLLHGAAISKKERVLHVAAGSGYGSVVMSYLGKSVVALEEDKTLYGELVQNIDGASTRNIETVQGELTKGSPKQGPYDVIFVEGAMEEVPFALLDSLKDGGRLLGFEPLKNLQQGQLSRAFVYKKIDKTYTKIFLFEAIAPTLKAFSKPALFQL